MKYIFFLLLLSYSKISFSQASLELNPEERAYLYHVVKKSPILENNIGRYFEYKGPMLKFMNGDINYDSIENIIINRPEQLYIRTSEIAKSPKGIIAEASNKMALWELNKTLLAARSSDKELEKYAIQYKRFEEILLPQLPQAAFKPTSDGQKLNKKLLNTLDPSLSFEDKAGLFASFNFLSPEEQLQTNDAINNAINKYVEERSFEIYKSLGGKAEIYNNVLVAAGDGSETSGLLNEREKDENGRWNKGLPKAVGLFPYQTRLVAPEKRKKTNLESLRIATLDFETVGENRLTQLHFDVWGYNGTKQTTVVVERKGLSYHLFGSEDTRFLTPDSTFSKGKTFQSVINDLQFNKIGHLNELIFGKKGFDYQIEYNTKKKEELEVRINKHEGNYSSMTQGTITSNTKAPRSVKKAKKKNQKTNNGTGAPYYQPTTNSGKKSRGKEQGNIVAMYSEHAAYKKKIADLIKDKNEAIDLMAIYQRRLDYYKEKMGYKWAGFTVKDGLYTFEDSTTFDILTQEFTFRADTLKTGFEVRLLAIPFGALSDEADEVMLHVNMIDAKPGFDARLQVELSDVFASNSWQLEQPLFSQNDSVAIRQLFEALLNRKLDFSAITRGEGIGKWNGQQTVKSPEKNEFTGYPGETEEQQQASRMSEEFVRLRTSYASFKIDREIQLVINTYTDPVRTNLQPKNADIAETVKKYGLSGNDYLSALRTAAIIQKMKTELNVLAGNYLKREEAKIVIDRINKTLDNTRVSVGATSFKWQELLK